ncbi:hypothetical protein G9C98_007635 [Cotesia typhae]|uniref:Uncharacterized protein n=1 Tax=Cotesia typhae TaxID=2053667 RepID=A0A8J5R170_9HYME|nr:hypothetical protein G9C98_007635 [Cotesia typhae]
MLRCLLLYLVVNYNFKCLVSIKVPVGNPEVRKNEPPDHIIPHTSHEHVPEPKYVPGNWLKPLKNRTKLDFTPQRLYSQVRRSSSVKKVPRKEALRRAQTDIEKEEVARLKESVSDKKINTFYTEEGFEDAAYDHAGHIRDADFKENYEQDQGKHRVKGLELKGESKDSDSEEEPRKNFYNSWQESGERTRTRDRFDDYDRNRGRYDKIIYPRKNSGGFGVSPRLIVENEIDLLEKDIKREEKETEKGAETEVPENLRELKDSDYDEEEEEEEVDRSSEDYHDDEDSFEYGGSSKFRIVAAEHPATAKTVDSYVGSIYTTELPKKSLEKQVLVVNAPKLDRREEKKNVQNLERSEENYVYPTLAQIYETWKRRGVERMYESRGESAEDFDKKLNRVDEIKKPKKTYLVMVRPKMESNGTNLDPKKKSVFSTTESGLQENVKPVPSYRYQRKQKESRLGLNRDKLVAMTKMVPPSLTSRSEYAEYHNLRRNGSTQPQHDRPRMVKALSHQSALRFGGSRPRYFVTGREKGDNEKVSEGWKNNRFISRKFVILRKKRGVFSAPIVVDEVVNGELDKRFSEDGEDQSGEESLEVNQEEEEKEEKVEVEVPEFNFAEVVAQNNKSKTASNDKGDTDDGIDEEKYPFYNLMEHSTALKYVINPSFVPRKTLGGSEFYDSRDKYMSCEDVEPDLSEEVPEKEPGTTEKNLPRLKGLGDKLLCLKEKYFDEKPLDNPLFVEKQIEPPTMPTEMDPEALRARFESLTEDYEDNSLRRMSGPVDLRSVESRIEESGDKQEGKWNNHAKKYRKRKRVSPTVSPYQREVYDDVMGTIKNLATMYKGVHVLSTRPPPKKKRQDSREKNDQVRINTSSRDVVVPLRARTRHPKLGGYRTNRVSYRTRPMVKGFKGTDGKVVGFFKTVRVHKRDLRNVESNLENVGIFDSRKIRNVSGVEGKNFSREDKNSRPRGAVRFGRFQDPGGQERRNEPRYTAVRKFDEVYEVETKRQEPKKEVDQYDVHEDVQEAPEKVEEGKEIYRPAANENAKNEDTEGTEDDEEEEEEEEEYEANSGDEEEADENDGSEYLGDSGSKSESEEVSADAERNYKEMSEGEKEFERFSFRPFSSYESYYDPKYAHLGPRVNKPAFHHPSFDSLESNKKDSEESEEYVFPWHEDEEDASEESRKHERFTGRHEYPWERRDRVRRERGKKYGPEWSPSESKTYFRKAYPWEKYSVPWKYGGRRGHFWPDEDQGQGGGKHTYPKSKFKFKKLIGKGRKVDPSTTSTPQIPATEEMSKVEATTPLIFTTTTPIVYTIRPRIRRPVTQRTIESLKEDQAKAHSSPRAVKAVPEFRKSANRGTIKANSSNLEVPSDRRIRGSATTRPSRKFLDNTTPPSRKVEHRSKVSKEEIITMSFPKMGSSESAEVKDNSSAGKIVQKVSILTKETPEHIYRTQEIDKNGVTPTQFNYSKQDKIEEEITEEKEEEEEEEGANNDNMEMDQIFLISLTIIGINAFPDSAGIVEMVNGLAYGGIPYGSRSGDVGRQNSNLGSYSGYNPNQYRPRPAYEPGSTVVITPNYRAPGLERRRRGPVQIYKLPGVVAPGVIGTLTQIGFKK